MKLPDPPNPILYAEPDEPIGLVQGQMPDSVNEWYVAQALDKLNIYYMFQFAIDGGHVRGGQIIDFVCWVGGWLPVYVNGTYWHDIRNDPEQPLRLAAARNHFHRDPVVLEEEETDTREKALSAVKKKVAF